MENENVKMVKAVILAAGRGKRIAPLTDVKPKPLLPIFGKPLIEHSLDALRKNEITECVIVTGYMAEKLRKHLEMGEKHGIRISYVYNPAYEDGNGLSLYAARSLLGDGQPFMVLMADHLIDPKIVHKALENVGKEPLLCVDYSPSHPPQLKDATKVLVDDRGFISDVGKDIPRWNCIDAGVLVLDKRFFEAVEPIKSEEKLTLSKCLNRMISLGIPIWACDISGLLWLDIDFPEDIAFAEKLLVKRGRIA